MSIHTRSRNSGPESVDAVAELDWLLEISALASHPKGRPPHDGSMRLGHMMVALLDRLGCALAALLVPERQIRLVQVSNRVDVSEVAGAFQSLEVPCLQSIQRTKQPVLRTQRSNHASSALGLRLHGVPDVGRHDCALPGALLLMRLTEDPEFTPLYLSVAKHFCRHIDTLLDADLDPATGLYTRLGLQQQVESVASGGAGCVALPAESCQFH